MSQERLIAGAMSGTSADGVDVAIVAITGKGLEMSARQVFHHQIIYENALKNRIFTARGAGSIELGELAKLGREISLNYARAVNEALALANLEAKDLSAIAAHGQTLFHDPPNTMQWFDPALLAAEVGCAVVSDFRRADCAAGGQGAPLVPFADYILFRNPLKNRVLLNIGGIANLTWLKAGGSIDEVIAFDTGPGNCVIDHLCRKYDPTGPGYDVDGKLARKGLDRNQLAVYLLHNHPFFRQRPPKSTDIPSMIAAFENAPLSVQPFTGHSIASSEIGFSDLLAAACLLTARTIQRAIHALLPGRPDEMIISGGGTQNPTLMDMLYFELRLPTLLSDKVGIPSQSREAIAFALLGAATLDGLPSNLPSVTGAKKSVVLGSITPKP